VCTKAEVKQALEENNKIRNENLDSKLLKLKEDVIAHINKRIDEIPEHKASPETKEKINKFEKECILRRGEFAITTTKMQSDIEQILKEIKEDKVWKGKFQEEIEKNYARKEEVSVLQGTLHEAKMDIEKLKKFMWQATAIVGAIVWAWDSFGKDFVKVIDK
jgi:DNA repair exonuclease SbcCD ATPase subunit